MVISTRSTRPGRLGLILFGLIVGILIAEIALRLIGYSSPEFYVTDASRGYRLRPGVSGWYSKENKVYIQINSDGLRDREHSTQKPPNTFRIAIVGDSYAEALQVPQDATFWSVMGNGLQTCSPNKQIEIINFGVSGYGTAQELITLRDQVWKYSPDLVLLAVTTSNDITDNVRNLKKARDIPYFNYRDNQPVIDDSFRETPEFQWRQSTIGRFGRGVRDHLRVVQAIIQGHRELRIRLASWRSKKEPDKPRNDGQKAIPSQELGTDNFIYVEPMDQTWNEAWSLTEELIQTMRNEVIANKSRFVVITLSNGIQVAPTPQVRTDFMQRFGSKDLFYPDRRIKALGNRYGFEVINLAPELLDYAEAHNVFLHGFGSNLGSGHWNEKGHQVAGEILGQKLCEGSWLK